MDVESSKSYDLKSASELLGVCEYMFLSANGENYPYVYSVLYGWEEQQDHLVLYFFDDKHNHKAEVLKANEEQHDGRVSVRCEIVYEYHESHEKAVHCSYASVTGFGKCELDNEDFDRGIDLIMTHYGFEGFDVDENLKDKKNMYKITLEKVESKRHILKPSWQNSL